MSKNEPSHPTFFILNLMPLNPSLAGDQNLGHPDGVDGGPEFRDPRTTLGVEEMVSEEEARKRREQLNRRPSYRMILKDLETVGDKPMKKEMDDNNSPTMNNNGNVEQSNNNNGGQQPSNSLQQLPDSSTDSQFVSNGVTNLIGNLPKSVPANSLQSGLRVGVSAASVPNQIAHLSPPTQSHLNLGQLNLLAPAPPQGRLIAEIPSQPQPQIPQTGNAPQPIQLTTVNNLDILGLKAADGLSTAFSQNEWQNNLLTNYNRQQIQQQPQQNAHLLQNPSNSGLNNIGQQQIGPPHGLGTRQGSASLTSFTPNRSDNDETSRKRQVRLLKNREAAKECRRKKKEYVKCLENRVAVLENQNKALIEELKTLKELYCRKEKGDMQ